jgi:hypothetical protein
MKIRTLATLLALTAASAQATEQPLFELHESVQNPNVRADWRTDTARIDVGRSTRTALLQASRIERRSKPVLLDEAAAIAASAPTGRDGRVLVEIRFQASNRSAQRAALRSAGAEIHTDVTVNKVEAWVDADRIDALQDSLNGAVIRPARLVRPMGNALRAGTVRSEGVTESGANAYQQYGADGKGQTIAIIDSGFSGWAALQASGDWPANANLERFEVDGSTIIDCSTSACPTFEDDDHGSNTVAIAHDVAPAAIFRVYKTRTVGEWYVAMLHASDETVHSNGRHSDVISASLSAPLDGVGDGSACPPNQPAPCGSIAEAAEIAQSRRSFVVNAAANNREEHWGGLYSPSASSPGGGYADALNFGNGTINASPYCLPDGFQVQVSMFWDDWSDVDHDYDLYLFRRNVFGGWNVVASSAADQNGSPASQNPQEFVSFTANGSSLGCSSGSNYGVMVARWNAPTNRNIQLFSNAGFGVFDPARSLGFPADSAAVFAVGALDLTIDNSTPAFYSSEGPVLAPGGGLPSASNPPAVAKPDGMSFSPVSTAVNGGTTFGGTSAAAPHVAGLAALLNQIRQAKPIITTENCALAIREGLEWLGQFNGNDLNVDGHDTVTGYGRMRAYPCSQSVPVAASTWTKFSPTCERPADSSLEEVFSSTGLDLADYPVAWRVFRWDASANRYYLVQPAENIEPDQGYWIWSDGPTTLEFEGVLPDITESIAVAAPGMANNGLGTPHIIANPRPIALDWVDVRFAFDGGEHDFFDAVSSGKVRPIIWVWDAAVQSYEVFNGLQFEGVLEPGQAFWIRANDDIEVRLPTPGQIVEAQSVRSKNSATRSAGAEGEWQIDLVTRLGEQTSKIRLGQHSQADEGFDLYDVERMSGFGRPDIELLIESAASRSIDRPMVREYRPLQDVSNWNLTLEVKKSARYTLSWSGDAVGLRNGALILPDGTEVQASRRGGSVDVWLDAGSHSLGWRFDSAGK